MWRVIIPEVLSFAERKIRFAMAAKSPIDSYAGKRSRWELKKPDKS